MAYGIHKQYAIAEANRAIFSIKWPDINNLLDENTIAINIKLINKVQQ